VEIAALAARQHGLVRLAQLLAAGLDHRAIARRVAAGRLHRVARGVYAVGHVALSREAHMLAAVFEAGDGAALSHLACAELWQVSRFRASVIDVVVPQRRRVKTATRIHRAPTLLPRDVTVYKGIPVTTIARMLVDLTDVLTDHQLANVIHEATFRRRFSLAATRDAIERSNGRHNLDVLERALALNAQGSAGTKSGNEDQFLHLLQLAGIPEPLVNTRVNGVEPDFHWPDLQLAIEIDGPGHARARTQREDGQNEAKLRAAGYEVIRVRPDELRRGVERHAASRP
jgi:hypothetical protein